MHPSLYVMEIENFFYPDLAVLTWNSLQLNNCIFMRLKIPTHWAVNASRMPECASGPLPFQARMDAEWQCSTSEHMCYPWACSVKLPAAILFGGNFKVRSQVCWIVANIDGFMCYVYIWICPKLLSSSCDLLFIHKIRALPQKDTIASKERLNWLYWLIC